MVIPQNSRFNKLQHITFGTDFHYEINMNSFTTLVELLKKFNSTLHIVHVRKSDTNSNEVAEAEWRKTADNIFSGMNYQFITVEDDNIKHGLVEFIQSNETELLVMLTHKHSFLERLFNKSQTAAMAYETTVPLLVLHD
jgi:K+-sensing histidine kinase KdpD